MKKTILLLAILLIIPAVQAQVYYFYGCEDNTIGNSNFTGTGLSCVSNPSLNGSYSLQMTGSGTYSSMNYTYLSLPANYNISFWTNGSDATVPTGAPQLICSSQTDVANGCWTAGSGSGVAYDDSRDPNFQILHSGGSGGGDITVPTYWRYEQIGGTLSIYNSTGLVASVAKTPAYLQFAVNVAAYTFWLDNLCIYTGPESDCYASVAPATPANETIPQSSQTRQTGTQTINGAVYTTVLSTNLEVTDPGTVYARALYSIHNANNPTTSLCRVGVDGAYYNSLTTRTLNPGDFGSAAAVTSNISVAAGNYTVEFQCSRSGGGTQYQVSNTTLQINEMVTTTGKQIVYEYNNVSGTVTGTDNDILSFPITTSQYEADTGQKRVIIAEWTAAYTYSATTNISTHLELDGEFCQGIKRYGTSGSTGSVGGACLFDGLTNSTTYNITFWGNGSGTVRPKIHAFEAIVHSAEVAFQNLTDLNIPVNLTLIKTLTGSISGTHTNADFMVYGGFSSLSTNTSQNLTYQLQSADGNSTTGRRTANQGLPGAVIFSNLLRNTSGTTSASLYAGCPSYNCTSVTGTIIGYVTDAAGVTTNSFFITGNTTYGANLTSFDVKLDSGTILTSDAGSIEVFTTENLINLTFPGTNDTNPKYFPLNVQDHDTSTNLTVTLRPWTLIQAYTGGGNPISEFTLNWTNTNTSNVTGQTIITDGNGYVPIGDGETYLVTIFNVNGSAAQSINLTGYLEAYNFTLLTSNSFNLSIYDEVTNTIINDTEFKVDLISDVFAQNYTFTNGTLEVTLLTPGDYTLRYYSTDDTLYRERDYIKTLVNQSYNSIKLYDIEVNDSDDVLVTVTDTAGDPLEGAIVSLLRYYITCNCYEVVEMSETSASGEALFWVQPTIGFYKWSIEYNGAVVFLSTSAENIVTATRTFTVNLGTDYYTSISTVTGMASALTINDARTAISFTWNDPSNIVQTGCLQVETLEGINYEVLETNCQNASVGSVVVSGLDLNNTRYRYNAYVTTSAEYSRQILFTSFTDLSTQLSKIFGQTGIFLGVTIIIGVAGIGAFISAVGAIIFTLIAMVFVSVLGLLPFTWSFLTGMAAIGIGLIVFLMRR